MRKFFSTLVALSLFVAILNAQSGSRDHTAKSVYGELGGNGLVFSGNYDMRFKGNSGLGFRTGIGLGVSIGVTAVTFPLGLNYLIGNGPHYFELGMGATYANLNVDWFGDNVSGGGWLFLPTAGYRFSQLGKGFQGRIYVSGVFAEGWGYFPWGGISAGYSF
jgi:hypothetical protein